MTHEVVYRIEELFDRRIGQVVYELWSSNPATGYQWLCGEYNTRANAREAIKRFRELEKKNASARD